MDKSPYDLVLDIVIENTEYNTDYLVTLLLDGEEETVLLLYDGAIDLYEWEYDWYEGQKEVKVLGFMPISKIKIHNYPRKEEEKGGD